MKIEVLTAPSWTRAAGLESVDAHIVVTLSWTRAPQGTERGRSSLLVASVDAACRQSPPAWRVESLERLPKQTGVERTPNVVSIR